MVIQPPMMRGTVLVVDDDPMIVDLLREVLGFDGYRVETAAGATAIAAAREVRPDLILLDLHMPGLDGVGVARLLRADSATAGIPVVALSAAHDLHARAAEMSADACLAKPFEIDELLRRVEDCTHRRLPVRAPLGADARGPAAFLPPR